MKILCFHPALAPYRVDFFNLLGELSDLKMVFLQANLQTQKFDQAKLLTALHCPYEHLTRGFVFRSRCIRFGLLGTIRRENPDVILAYEASPVTIELIVMKKLGLVSAEIWTSMDDSPEQVRSRMGFRRVMRDWVLRNVSRVIVPSHTAVDAYCGIPNVKAIFSVVPIVHDTAAMRKGADRIFAMGCKWRKENCHRSWSRILLFVGRLVEVKNLPWLIEKIQTLPEDVGLVVVGDGAMEADLRDLVSSMGLGDRVLFAGRKEGDGLYAMMAMADALVLCSHSETYGAVVAEALQWGTPCVVARHLGASVLIDDGTNGALFEKDDEEGFAAAYRRIPQRSLESLLPCDLRKAVANLIAE